MNIIEGIVQAFDSVRSNKLRASLTLLSISIGVFAIISAGALVSSLDSTVSGSLADLGENSFAITRLPKIQTSGHEWRKYRKRKPITYSQYEEFKEALDPSNMVSSYSVSGGLTISSDFYETDPDVTLIGTDENYFKINNRSVGKGRDFTASDIDHKKPVAIIGNDILVKVFPNISPIGKRIKIKNHHFDVVGILEEQGAVLGQSLDNQVIIPLTQFLRYYAYRWEESLQISIKTPSKEALLPVVDEAIGIMRTIRKVKPWEENNFELETNESLSEQFSGLTVYVFYFGLLCGSIALIAAGVGIMNIMLVSVNERTREIGIRKAVGAKRSWILMQFIIETVTLCQIGGIIGIGFGLIGSALLSSAAGFDISLPVDWILISIGICTFLGVAFGAYPSWKAAKLDPIEALRYE